MININRFNWFSLIPMKCVFIVIISYTAATTVPAVGKSLLCNVVVSAAVVVFKETSEITKHQTTFIEN